MNKTKTKLTNRGWFVLVIIPVIVLISLLTYATRDVCYVGQPDGNMFGYGSCNKMIDKIVSKTIHKVIYETIG